MGAAGSVEEQGGTGGTEMERQRPPSTAGSSRGSGRNTPTMGSRPGSRPGSRRASVSSASTWKNAFKGNGLQNPALRKERALALGRKSAVTVGIDKTGFSLQHIRICEGQMVSYDWYEPESQGYNITQVIHDGDQYRPVPGGFNSGPVTKQGHFDQQFNLAGIYKFVSAGIRCTPLTVEVFPRKDVEAELNDQGFAPKIIRVDEGSAVTWRWTGCGIPHTVSEVRYNHKRGAMVQREQMERQIPTKAGSFRKEYPKPGIYYFQTEGATTGTQHTCVVHVRERQRETRIEVFDRSFSPPILVIEEGDRIWWSWNKDKCKKMHCIYQIEPPDLQHPQDDSYKNQPKPVKNGFKWPQPSKSALMSCEFYEQGVYYYSDHSFDEAAEYIGTIIVKPKTKDHFIEVTAEGFSPDVLYADVGDRIWWTWKCEDATIPKFSLREIDKVLSPLASRPAIEEENTGEGSYMDEALENLKVQVGLEMIQLGSIGVYTYCLADPDQRSIASCSIISSAGSRNHTVHVTDSGFEPKVVTVHPSDRVWWVWQDSKQQHNIIQVSHQGNHIKNGFCSGSPSDCPSAFMTQFATPGVYYYISTSLAKSFGAVVVSSQPKVHEVQVSAASIAPDPVILSVNDVVVWTFKGLRNHDVQQLNSLEHLLDIQMNSQHLQHARRTLSRLFTEKGVFHYTSKAFLKSTKKPKGEQRSDKSRISSLLVDDPSDSMVVRVNSQGFHPKLVNITKGQSVLWTWKEAGEEAHNIIHVNSPDSDAPLSVIQGGQSFNSGRPVTRNSFLYTFDEPGNYCTASQGGPGFAGTVNVLDHSVRASTPYVAGRSPSGEVAKNSVIHLQCDSGHAQIFYTLDGSAPDQSRVIPKNHKGLWDAVRGRTELYKPDKGVVLRQSGLTILRAIAVAENTLNSYVVTANRFVVLPGEDDNRSVSSEEPEQMPADDGASWQWWQAVPVIKGCFTAPGILEIFWEPPPAESNPLVKGYQVFLNGVSYCPAFPSNHNSVNIAGLAGGRMYELMLEVYPHNSMFLPHKSNKLMMKCPKTTSTGGPLISLEQTEKSDTLTIVWMAIATPDCPMKGYRVYLNGQMCGSQVVPDANSDRCKVVIEGCELDRMYQVVVAAIPRDGSTPKMSNELQISLPLDMAHIRIPPVELRVPDDDLYREYIEVSEGAGYVDSSKKKKKKTGVAVVEVQDGAHLRYEERPPQQGTAVIAAVPVLGHQQGQEQFLPAPVITAEGRGSDRILVRWCFDRSSEPLYRLMVNVVNVVGKKFSKNVNSNISFECLQEEGNSTTAAVQHCWNVTSGTEIEIGGLIAGTSYTIFVVANYALVNAKTPTELQAKSSPIKFTTLGPPPAPTLRPFASEMYQATLAWDTPLSHSEVELTGYRILVDGLQLGEALSLQTHKTTIDNLQPGRTISVSVIAVTNHPVGNSEPSNVVRVTCPHRPPCPQGAQQPSYKRGAVIIGWEKPNRGYAVPFGEDCVFYRIFVDNQWHGEVKATATGNRSGYQYYLTDLQSGQAYDINIRAYAGQVKVDPQADQLFCITESEQSNTVPVMCPAPPKSPCLRVEGMHTQGIDINWEMPQQFGDAQISGYQLMKDSKLYGSIMPPDIHSLRIKDVNLGDRVQLQILALTDHPVGREAKDRETQMKEGRSEEDGDSGVGTGTQATDDKGYKEVFIGDRYSACRPGPTLVITYSGLVAKPERVWCEQVSGHSAMIVWEPAKLPRAHFIQPENYQVTWWPKDQGSDLNEHVNSQSTKDDHMAISGLKPNTMYNVVVEARKMQNYSAINEGSQPADDGYGNMFILTGKSEQLAVRTARPPSLPTNLGIVATTCNSIQVAWDPPVEGSVEITTVRLDAVAMKASGDTKHKAVEVLADSTSATLDGLPEKVEFLITVTFVTEEYFDQLPEGSEVRSKRTLPLNKPPPEDTWLPSSSMIGMTSGSEAPTNVKVTSTTLDSITLTWTPPVVYGSNRLQGTVVRWSDAKSQDSTDQMTHHKSFTADLNVATLEDLYPGVLYKVIVEAVVSVKTNIVVDSKIPEEEKSNRRTTHVPAKAIYVRSRCPCEPPKPLITAYTNETIQLYWEKPLLYRFVGKDVSGLPRYLKMSLEGYRLEINGKPHMKLMASAQSCTLVKCRPGKNYQIVLVALTCTEEVKREKRRRGKDDKEGNHEWNDKLQDLDIDESPSEPIDIALPAVMDNILSDLNINFAAPSSRVDADTYSGDVHVEWGVQGNADSIEEFLVTWRCDVDGSLQRKVVNRSQRICSIPVTNMKCIYDVYVEPQYDGQYSGPEPQKAQVLIPGPPDPPEIWMRSSGKEEFIIEWAEPRLWSVRVHGYQVFLNGKKVGNQLSHSHRKAVIPCKPNRTYKVSLVGISADPNYLDSVMSNTLLITPDNVRFVEPTEEEVYVEDLPVRLVKVTDTTIQLDWIKYNEPEGVVYYRVTWSSVAQPAEREVKLPAGERSCMLHKCYPGTNHFLRVYAMGKEEHTIDVSRQMTVQTCAPPDTPVVKIRACNFKYIAIEWEKPTTYGDMAITGYKVYVNGVVEAVLGADQLTYSLTSGHWCREYAFQVQAIGPNEHLSSKPSDPLVVSWPGVQQPVLKRVPAISGNSVKVAWDMPQSTEGIKIKMYKVVCIDLATQQPVQVVSPIHPDTTEAELHNLKAGSYHVICEVHLHGTNEIVKSEPLSITPTLTPDPPHITVTVIGLDERRQVEKVTCDLINKRDRLINFLTNREVSQTLRVNDEDQVLQKVTEDLAHVEDMLDDCLASLTHYTGHLLAHVSWACPQSNADIEVSGYRVLVDGKQYGTTLHAGIQNVRIKLGLQHASHRMCMISVSDKPRAMSIQSNVVELLTEPFKPFSFFSFLGTNGPKTGGLYAPTLLAERKERRTINQGLLKRHVPPPAATLMEVFEGEYRPLFPPSGPRSPTAILFWAKWNPASWKALGWFLRYARAHTSQYEFVAVACLSNDPTANDRQELVHIITENGWRDDKSVRHVTSHCAAGSKTIGSEYIKNRNGDVDTADPPKSASDVTKLFGVGGVPMLVVVHPGDYIAWKGRYCAYDYIGYENFLKYVFAQTTGMGITVTDPWDTNIDVDALDGVSKRGMSESQLLIHRPTNNSRLNTGNTTTHRINNNRPASAKNPLFKKTGIKKPKDKLSVNSRPYSASSPYSQKLISEDTMGAPPKRRVKSGRKTNGYY